MASILDKLAELAEQRVAESKKRIPFSEVRSQAESIAKGSFAFEQALKKEGVSFICECKKASPSKGLIAEHYPYTEIAKAYEEAGADCISVLTEPFYFMGSDSHLKEITDLVSIPCIRKDFTVDPYMIYEAKNLGASAVLLICSILEEKRLQEYFQIADSLGLSALVETHSEAEIETALKIGARIIGVNNRNLHNFDVDTGHALNLRKNVPDSAIFVMESGIRSPEEIALARQSGVDAVLIGETMMRAENKGEMLKRLKGEIL